MNLNKHLEFLEPTAYRKQIHIIGVGAIGSRIAEVLTRLGFTDLHIYDFDKVEDGNITNQLYTFHDIGELKTDALSKKLLEINPHIKVTSHGAYIKQKLKGTVFLCVDSIELRREIIQAQVTNTNIDLMLDTRMRLTDAQGYTAVWNNAKHIEALLNTMQFNDEDDLTPLSVCGTTLSVAPTILTIVSYQIMNFILYIKGLPIKQVVLTDVMEFQTQAFSYK